MISHSTTDSVSLISTITHKLFKLTNSCSLLICSLTLPLFQSLSLQRSHLNYPNTISLCSLLICPPYQVQLKKHNQAHKTLKTFKTGLAKGKLKAKVSEESKSEKKKDDDNKKKRGLTSFNLYCRENRTDVKVLHPQATNQELFKHLGTAWKNLDNSTKSIWERRAREENELRENTITIDDEKETGPSTLSCPFCERNYGDVATLRLHLMENHGSKPSNSGALDNIAADPSQGRLHKCNYCNKLTNSENDLKKHIENEHGDEILFEPEEAEKDLPLEEMPEDATAEVDHPEEDLEFPADAVFAQRKRKRSNSEHDFEFAADDAVFVKRKTVHWPAKILEIKTNEIILEVFHNKAIVKKSMSQKGDIKRFSKDQGQGSRSRI